MTDYILEISYDASDPTLDERVQAALFLSPSSGSSSLEASGTLVVSAYFDSAAERDDAMDAFRELDVELHAADRPRVDWLELYQQSLEPIFIGRRFVVAPDPNLIPVDSDRLTIVVPQEQAFGTGSHETTSLCMAMLEDLPMAGLSGLDVGSGSGILALAMLGLGAARAIAFDNDPDAYGALRDNRIRNAMPESRMPLFIGGTEALRGGSFEMVTMNIIPEVIIPLLPQVVARLAAQGRLILSGILAVRKDDVIAAASRNGLRLVAESGRGEWWCGMFSF